MEELESPVFTFELKYADNPVNCKVLMQESSYDIYFDEKFMGSLEHTEDFQWILASGVILPQEIIQEIGFEIEHRYR
jgi:hypothetical protein